MFGKIVASLILIVGESAFVFAEMNAAHQLAIHQDTFFDIFFDNLPIILLGGILVLLGYSYGIKAFESIWLVVVVSIFGMLLVEPIIAYSLFRTLPELGAIIGMIFSFIGCIYTFKSEH